MDVMRPAMDLAEASGTNLASTTSDITNTLQAFGLKITQSPWSPTSCSTPPA